MNKRELSRLKTRESILEKTRELMLTSGVLKLTTNEVAKALDISHGSIFQHFGSREMLIYTVLDREVKKIAVAVQSVCPEGLGLDNLLENCLQVLAQEEEFLRVVYKELPYFPEGIKREVIALEALLRNVFYMKVESDLNLSGKEIAIRLDGFFSTLVRYLTLRELYAPSGHVLEVKKQDLVRLFAILFKED